jgi:hypothetical protein
MRYAKAVAPTFQDFTRDPARLLAVRSAIAKSIETLRGGRPVAALALQMGGDAEIIGFAPPGTPVAIGETRTVTDPDGRFSLAATGVKGEVEVTFEFDDETTEIKAPLIAGG